MRTTKEERDDLRQRTAIKWAGGLVDAYILDEATFRALLDDADAAEEAVADAEKARAFAKRLSGRLAEASARIDELAPACGEPRVNATHCERCAGLSEARTKRLAELERAAEEMRAALVEWWTAKYVFDRSYEPAGAVADRHYAATTTIEALARRLAEEKNNG